MGILEITLPSGTEADLETMDTTNTRGQYKKVEKGFRSINLYFDTVFIKTFRLKLKIANCLPTIRKCPYILLLNGRWLCV